MICPFARLVFLLCLGSALCSAPTAANAGFAVKDDAGDDVVFDRPAMRIVSLAPNLTELLFAAGAGDHVIAADEYSDYPPAAKTLPRIGSAYALDLERVLALKPDLVVAWKSGSDARKVARLRELGIRVFLSEQRALEDIPRAIETFGRIAGTENIAHAEAAALRARYRQLAGRYAHALPVKVFFEIWNPPIMTVNGKHMIDSVLRLCGGMNVFAAAPALTPTVTSESVVAANPDVIIGSGTGNERPAFLDAWQSWPRIAAVEHGLLTWIPGDLIDRAGPRIFDGAEQACNILDRARVERAGAASNGNK
jgi:iron complex transport system substrate-binding protein